MLEEIRRLTDSLPTLRKKIQRLDNKIENAKERLPGRSQEKSLSRLNINNFWGVRQIRPTPSDL